jgi:hypothetical protein
MSRLNGATTTGVRMTGDDGVVEVDIDGLQGYSKALLSLSMSVIGPATETIGHMTYHMFQAFKRTSGDAGVFPEGQLVAQELAQNMSDFNAFSTDLFKGLFCISNAAGVVAVSYHNADAQSQADITDVDFAFGDRDVKRPDGLAASVGKTFATVEFERSQETGGACAAMRPGAQPIEHRSDGGSGYVDTYADHSYVVMTTTFGSDGRKTTVTTVYDPSGKPLQKTSETYDSQDNLVGSSKQSGDGGTPTAGNVRTETVTDANGNKTVVTTTTVIGDDGKPTEHKTETPIDPGQHHEDPNKGPVQSEEERLNQSLPANYQPPRLYGNPVPWAPG